MFKFDISHYEKIVNGALALQGVIEKAADEITKKGYKNIYLIGCGGTYSHALSLKYMMDSISTLEVHAVIAAEFMLMNDHHFGKDSLCIFSSRTGTTKEIVAASAFCKQAGATVVSFVSHAGTPLCTGSDYLFLNYAEDENLAESIYLQNIPFLLRLAFRHGDYPEYAKFVLQLGRIAPYLVKAKQGVEDACLAMATKHKDTPYHMVVGSGNLWGEAYDYAMCILEEMQWIKTKSIHAAEFFHGTLELVEPGTSLILFYGEDETRPLMDRVYNFAKKYTDQIIIFDTKTVELPLDEPFRKLVSPMIIYTLTERLSCHLAQVRNHPLSTRRYYNQMVY
jgi:fructoselysine-6-phosphate deglycase